MSGKVSSSRPRPDSFGTFAVRGDLGESRFGPVYLGRDPSTNTRVVIRTFELSREWREFGEQSDLLDSFRTLCETTLDHAGLARPLAFGAEGDIPYLVYSELAGTAMDVVMRQDGPRPVADVLQRARQLAEAIDCAASAGVHHGMMAPCDVILGDERAGVTGFGLAQALIKSGVSAEAEPPYASPQRLAGARPTRADDIYSLAAVTLELLIGTPKDPDQDMSPALREAQGLSERRRIPRPAPHETRVFTTIAGADAGKLRASFAAAFSEEPSARPSTAAEFVASFEDAFSNRRLTDEAAPSAAAPRMVAVETVSDDAPASSEEPPSPAPLETVRPERVVSEGPLESARGGRAARRRRARERRRETLAASQPPVRESHEHAPHLRTPESRSAPPEPIIDVELVETLSLTRVRPMDDASYRVPVRSETRALVAAVAVAFSFGAGFGGGFLVGQRSSPATEAIDASRSEPVAHPQLARTVVEDPQPVVTAPATVAPNSEEKVSSSEPVPPPVAPPPAAPRQRRVTSSEKDSARPAHATAATTKSGSLQVVSRPSGAQVFVDDSLIGTTPFLLSNIAAGSRRLRIELSGYSIWTTSVQIEAGARSRVSASLEP